jgi:hypothetical protein
MTYRRSVLLSVLGLTVAFGTITLVALEGREVVVLRTVAPQGETRRTRTWVADDEGYAWIEAANAARPFLLQINANPNVELERGGAVRQCRAYPTPNPEGHERIRRLLLLKYGWADRWVALLTDTSESIAVRLECR